mgnify:CR=1 FL=1
MVELMSDKAEQVNPDPDSQRQPQQVVQLSIGSGSALDNFGSTSENDYGDVLAGDKTPQARHQRRMRRNNLSGLRASGSRASSTKPVLDPDSMEAQSVRRSTFDSPPPSPRDPSSSPITTFLKLFFSSFSLLNFTDYIFTIETSFFWRRSLAWSHTDGKALIAATVQKYSSLSLISSLLLAAQVAIFFSPCDICEDIRSALLLDTEPPQAIVNTEKFLVGLTLLTGTFLALMTIFSAITAWGMLISIQPENAHAILRSGIGLYATHLPIFFFVCTFCDFILTMFLFMLIFLHSFGQGILGSLYVFIFFNW